MPGCKITLTFYISRRHKRSIILKLNSFTYKKSNNLQFIRFVAAIAVILSHSFSISGTGREFFDSVTDGTLSLGGISVSVFFVCGGYLIMKSARRNSTFSGYFSARAKRIFPPLWLTVIVSIVWGGAISLIPLKEYFMSAQTYKYLLNGVLIPVHGLPGVFESNPYGSTVNGALWTLSVEFVCYIMCFAVAKMHLDSKKRYLLLSPLAVAAIVAERFLPPIIASAVRPSALFFIGMGYCIFEDKIELNVFAAAASAVAFAVTVYLEVPDVGVYIFLPYILFTLSFGIPQLPGIFGKLGDISYGIYLWGFPVQQSVVSFVGQMNPYVNFAVSALIAILLGTITYYLTEKPFIKGAKNERKQS